MSSPQGATQPPDPPDPSLARSRAPHRIGPYEVVRTLGAGGMGVVYLVRDPQLDRVLALKLLRTADASPDALQRFWREADALGQVHHKNVIRIHGKGELPGAAYLLQEFVEGQPLSEHLRSGPLPDRRVAEVARDLAEALDAVHRAGILHRDVKPQNVMLCADGTPVLLDFGLARDQNAETLTRTGELLGTPTYMAPEQVEPEGGGLDERTDVYALGAVLYEMLTGARPYEGSMMNVVSAIVLGNLPPLETHRPDVPKDLEAICLKAMATEPADRYPTAAALRADLERALGGESTEALRAARARGRIRLGSLLLGLALLAGAGAGVAAWRAAPEVASTGEAPAPPRLRLADLTALPELGAVRVTGAVESAADWVELRVTDGPSRRVAPGEFSLQVPVAPQTTDLELRAVDGHGGASRALRRRLPAVWPKWFARLQGAARPPLPLPAGLSPQPEPGEYRNARDGSILVWVPPGRFPLGPPRSGSQIVNASRLGGQSEVVPRVVERARGVFFGKYEVSWAQYARFAAATERALPDRKIQHVIESVSGAKLVDEATNWVDSGEIQFEARDEHPVFRVTFEDAQAYCAWAGLRLPSAEEWEVAARGSDGRPFPWGDEKPGPRHSNTLTHRKPGEPRPTRVDLDRFDYLAPVESFPAGASPFGVRNLSGNVTEWVADPAPELRGGRQQRGANWTSTWSYDHHPWFVRAAPRGSGSMLVGIRVALDPRRP